MKNKTIAIYAAGSFKIGYGHLYRIYKLWYLNLRNFETKFFYKNNVQRDFYFEKQVDYTNVNNLDNSPFDLLIVDAKKHDNNIETLKKISKKSIIIDCYEDWIMKFDEAIIPSFYCDVEKIKKFTKKNYDIKFGKEYSLVLDNSEDDIQYDILITFGGSDPNDITTKVIEAIYNKLDSEVMVIIGPGFKRNIEEFRKQFPKFNFIGPVDSVTKFVKNSKLIITALGTTIQDIEYFQNSSIIVANYAKDINCFYDIQKFSSNSDNWVFHGIFSHIDSNKLLYQIKKIIDKDQSKKTSSNFQSWGGEWITLLS